MANPDHVMTIAQLQPDGTLTGDIVFDIPKDAAIAHLDLHELPSTPGAKVKVG